MSAEPREASLGIGLGVAGASRMGVRDRVGGAGRGEEEGQGEGEGERRLSLSRVEWPAAALIEITGQVPATVGQGARGVGRARRGLCAHSHSDYIGLPGGRQAGAVRTLSGYSRIPPVVWEAETLLGPEIINGSCGSAGRCNATLASATVAPNYCSTPSQLTGPLAAATDFLVISVARRISGSFFLTDETCELRQLFERRFHYELSSRISLSLSPATRFAV
jgi:hypothetical protein